MSQFSFPKSDTSTGAWTTTPLYPKIEDNSDVTYVISKLLTTPDTFQCDLDTITDPYQYDGHQSRLRFRQDAAPGQTVSWTWVLKQSSTTIQTGSYGGGNTSFLTPSNNLSVAQAESITNYSALNITVTATGDLAIPRRRGHVARYYVLTDDVIHSVIFDGTVYDGTIE